MTGWRLVSRVITNGGGPEVWVLPVGKDEIVVHNTTVRDRWFMHCNGIGLRDFDLGSLDHMTADEAKAKALREAASAARLLHGADHRLTRALVAKLPSVWARLRAEPRSALVLAAFLFALFGWAITFALSGPGVW
ncbi:hypothetical protein BV509_00970 [Rhodovulum sulfidophilum]|uniref:Uncharacterized protein n=1 Tax=Rhodovulum visakhapatnamense TaxID=364297 RepID=A0ABS1RGL3_9RHOB|nr:hypothetical protein [Rhodovulum visakhapatnamense]MBL3569907.1 hypothetical protein [Rhodovulum visakhapatnamense]MBL3578400.1 hypothetical protein [Rhodovulum visakhapatnamense]OLS43060.1 hypothetical protein BV509_00970 [Rhodovulum sulfidophilum]